MHEFFRLGREERGKKLAEAKQQRHRIDSRERMFRRKLEDRFVEQTAAKARAKGRWNTEFFLPLRSPGTTAPSVLFFWNGVAEDSSKLVQNGDVSPVPTCVLRAACVVPGVCPLLKRDSKQSLPSTGKANYDILPPPCLALFPTKIYY